eukprot:55794_1
MTSNVKRDQMYLLQKAHPIIDDTVRPRLLGSGEGAEKRNPLREPCELKICDLDDVVYKMEVKPEDLSTFRLSILLPAWSAIKENGGVELLDTAYKGMVEKKADSGYDITLVVDLNKGSTAERKTTANALAEFKRNLIGAPFGRAFDQLLNSTSGGKPAVSIPWRATEDVYIVPAADRVTVIFAVDFRSADERAICKVFLMEFSDAQRSVNNAPPVNFTPDPPLELQDFKIRNSGVIGYLSFIIFPQHVQEGRKEKCVTLISEFRAYLHYHMKATKTYMHIRMRKRTQGMLKVLKRAIPEEEEKSMKTASGKTFMRSP